MNDITQPLPGHEPSLHTVEMVCDRLAAMGVQVGPDTARDLIRAVLAAEAPRVDARLREALDTTLQTIRVAAQAAMGVLATTSPSEPRRPPAPKSEPADAAPARSHQPAAPRRPAGRISQPRRVEPDTPPPPPRRPRDDEEVERRPVFRRPRGR
ncbi:MAG TPA: hypothetical protein VJQ44_14795 [Gemmatimonadales bacterium]|nr:hypothetical protein [Gemmatimonadales bacterium]